MVSVAALHETVARERETQSYQMKKRPPAKTSSSLSDVLQESGQRRQNLTTIAGNSDGAITSLGQVGDA
jgi:hypothetical protein